MNDRYTPNWDNLVFLYICNEPQLFDVVDYDFFKNKHIRLLYKLTTAFYKKFKTLPFDLEIKSIEQIEELSYENEEITKDSNLSEKENVQIFINNVKNIFTTDVQKYSAKWLKETAEMWIQWENSKKGWKLAIDHSNTLRNKDISPERVAVVIKECQKIVIDRTSIIIDNDLGEDFMNPNSHIQTAPNDLHNCGFQNVNKWACEDGIGGFENGTLTILVGESNIGKCVSPLSSITVRNKRTGKIFEITMEEFYNKLKV